MMEELHKLRQSIKIANAKISYLSEGFKDLEDSFETISTDLDAFVQVYEISQQKVEERLQRLEKHVGLE